MAEKQKPGGRTAAEAKGGTMKDRVILHCDMNSFFASVELLEHPELRDKPVAVSGEPGSRHGIILAKNDPAKKYGVVTAETIWQAKKKCPDLILLRPHYEKYKYFCGVINDIYLRFTDLVEPFSIDESWLDVTASQKLFGTGEEIANTIRETVLKETGLTLSAGVSFNKIFAKMGSDYKKPNATTVISRENYREILWPLPVRELFFAGKKTTEKLTSIGIKTIGEIAQADPKTLANILGKHGTMLWTYANGMDDSPVLRYEQFEPAKSVGNGVTFKRDLTAEEDIRTAVIAISDRVAGRLRRGHFKACGIKVDIKDPYFKQISRQKQIDTPTNLAAEIAEIAMEIIRHSWKEGAPIRLITITGINLVDADEDIQLSLFAENEERHEKNEKLELTMDKVRGKFGNSVIGFATAMDNDLGIIIREEK